MTLFLGIDLGSTTSKAVLLDEHERVVGRGITNTRSNYDVAVEVAKREALCDARLGQLAPLLGPHAQPVSHSFHVLSNGAALGRLCERIRGVAGGDACALALVSRLSSEAAGLFGGTRDRGAFFRDLVAARFYSLLEEIPGIDYDAVLGLYDRAMLAVENEVEDVSFAGTVRAALEEALVPSPLHAAICEQAAALEARPPDIASLVGTGYGRQRLPFPRENIRSEILCHGLGAHAMFPGTRTVLDIGGQDTKAIQVDENGLVTAFQMNDRCAAGCGRYLGYIADELNLGLHELGPLALKGTKPCRITSTCTVFAGIELRDLLAVGEARENILAGLHRAIVTRAMSLLSRSGGVREEFTFTGGVAKNTAAVLALRELIARHYGQRTIHIDPDSIYTGALGAALFARRGVPEKDVDETRLECASCPR